MIMSMLRISKSNILIPYPRHLQCVCVMKSDRFLFAASEFGNYALYQFQAIGKILNGSHHPFTSDGNDDGFNPVLFKPKVCEKIFLEFDQMESFDAHFGNDRPGLAISELALSQLPGVPEMQSSGQLLKRLVTVGLFLGTTPSLGVSMIGNDSLMQVHPTGIRHIREDGRIDEWRTPGKQTIVKPNLRRVVLWDIEAFSLPSAGWEDTGDMHQGIMGRIAELVWEAMEYVLEKLDGMKETIDEYHQAR
ncbi:spliceosome-associated protein 130 A [Tanacetum coccineum]